MATIVNPSNIEGDVVASLAFDSRIMVSLKSQGGCYQVPPFPSVIFVATLLDLCVALEALPGLMAGDLSYLGNGQAHLEQAGNSLVAKIVKVQVFDPKQFAGIGEPATDNITVVWENPVLSARHGLDDRPSFLLNGERHVISLGLSGVFHVADGDFFILQVIIFPSLRQDGPLAMGFEDRCSHDFVHGHHARV